MGIVKAFSPLAAHRPGLGQMNGHFIARGAPRDIRNLSVQHFAEKVVAAQLLLLSPSISSHLRPNQRPPGGCSAMIALQGTRCDQYGASGIECFRCKKLELPHLIARQ